MHVGDGLTAGTPDIQDMWAEMQKLLNLGQWEDFTTGMKLCGRLLRQTASKCP